MAGATIKARVPGATAVDLLLDTDPGLGSPSTVAGTEGSDSVWEFALTGLTADTQYYYGFDGSSVTGTFRTFPTAGDPANFSVALASCAGHSGGEYRSGVVANSPAFDAIVAADPLLFVHLGDRGYPDISTNNVASFRTNYANNMAMARQNALHLAMPVAYQWSDHDFGPNDADGTSASKPAAQQVYREHVPHWPLDSAGAIYQTFAIGRVRFFLLDTRSDRSPKGNTDNASKTMLGATQKAWLKAEMLAATEALLVVLAESPWNSSNPISWGVYSTERQELIDYWDTNALTEKVLIVNGDYHFSAADDGTNYPGGIPLFAFSPLDAGYSTNEGTYSAGIHKDSHQQFGILDITDDGDQIIVTGTGYAA